MVTYSSKILSTFTSGLGTQIWDGKTWDKLEISSPPDRPDSALVYDSEHDLVILFGGKRDGVLLNDTWVFDGKNWRELRFSSVPAARDAHAISLLKKVTIRSRARGEICYHSSNVVAG